MHLADRYMNNDDHDAADVALHIHLSLNVMHSHDSHNIRGNTVFVHDHSSRILL